VQKSNVLDPLGVSRICAPLDFFFGSVWDVSQNMQLQPGQVTAQVVQVVQVANSVPPDRGEMVWTSTQRGL